MESKENYLRAIYGLTEDGEEGTSTSEVADKLDVSDASVSEAISKLEDDNLVCRAPYKGFTLSPMGREKGEKLASKFSSLKNIFRTLEIENPEEEADEVEHSISEEAVEKLSERLN